jgi:hypothetical protein
MSFKDFISGLFSPPKQEPPQYSVADFYGPNRGQNFDPVARRYCTNGVRWDGSSYDGPYRPPPGGFDGRGDFLSPNFGSQLHQQADGSWRGIASAEVKRGADGLFHRLFDFRPKRRRGLDNNDDSLW